MELTQHTTNASGFTLIEVLVASAILMMSLGILLQLFASALDREHRVGETAHLLTAQRLIIHTIEGINPAINPNGKGIAEGLHYHWNAVVMEPFKKIQSPQGSIQRELALFSVKIGIVDARGKQHRFNATHLGWRQIR